MKKLFFLLLLIPSILLAETRPNIWERAANGSVRGVSLVKINGYNGAITTTNEPVWAESAAYTVPSAALSSPYCASTDNTNDKAAGTGCLTMSVSGVNSSYATFTETITLNGQTSVTLTTSNILFINTIMCLTAGSTFANTGTIRCGTGTNTSGVPAVVHAHMAVGIGVSQTAMYAVPANTKMLCRNMTLGDADSTISRPVSVVLDRFVDPVAAKVLIRTALPLYATTQSALLTDPTVHVFAAKTIWLAQALQSAATGPVTFHAECLLVNSGTNATPADEF